MKRIVVVTAVSLVALAPFLWTVDAWARAGRGGSGGSRGSRSYSAPIRPSSPAHSPASPAAPSVPTTASRSTPGSSGWGGMVPGLVVGGLLGSLLFGGGGGFGLMDMAVLGLLAYLLIRKMRGAQSEPAAVAAVSQAGFVPATRVRALDAPDAPSPWSGVASGASPARPPGPIIDEAEVARAVTDIFLKVQAAWTARDLEPAAAVLTPEMRTKLQKDCEQIRAQGRINRIENITVRAVEVTETWQEPGYNFMAVRIEASLLDYTTDEKTGEVLEGSATEPVTFEEYWTLTRAVWIKTWRLCAIQQPAVTSA